MKLPHALSKYPTQIPWQSIFHKQPFLCDVGVRGGNRIPQAERDVNSWTRLFGKFWHVALSTLSKSY